MIFRNAITDLAKWFHNTSARKPLIIRGARQIGKSTLIRMFAKSENIKLLEYNLELEKKYERYFNNLQVEKIISDIEIDQNVQLNSTQKILIFFDEIQSIPKALHCLRYFYEKHPHIAIVCAGSLLEFVLESADFSMPVGRVDYYFLGPIRFSEFLAKENPKLYSKWKEIQIRETLPSLHEQLTKSFYRYLSFGGMPEALMRCLEKNYSAAEQSLRSIIYNYKNDFNKYRKMIPQERLEKIFEYAGTNLGRKIKYSNISSDIQSRELKKAIGLLAKAQVLGLIYNSNCSGIPIASQKDENTYKFLFLDVGLHILMSGLGGQTLERILENENSEANLIISGTIHEQFIGQHLLYAKTNVEPELYYWLREGKSNNAEVDFVLQHGTKIIPIEVKSGKTGSLKSLTQFVMDKKTDQAVKFSSNPAQKIMVDYRNAKFTLIQLPHYLIERVLEFIE